MLHILKPVLDFVLDTQLNKNLPKKINKPLKIYYLCLSLCI